MSGDLVVGSGGVVMVSDSLRETIHRLGQAALELKRQHTVIAGLREEWRMAGLHASGGSVRDALRSMDGASDLLARAHHRADTLAASLRHGLAIYETAEKIARGVVDFAREAEAWQLGVFARVFGAPIALGLGADVAMICLVTGTSVSQLKAAVAHYVEKNPGVITSPRFVNGVAAVVDNADQFEDGFLGVPPGVSQLLGPHGLGVTGPTTAAASVVGLGGMFGLFRETPVSVRESPVRDHLAPATGLRDRMRSIPSVSPGHPEQVRIEKYTEAGKPDRFDVYIGGTASFDPHATNQPFDLTSDLTGVAGQRAGAYRAVLESMRQAGVTASTPVVVTGYSEGGLLAAMVAGSGRYDVKGLVTMGAPSGQIRIPDSVPMFTIKNTDDLVPATGGFDVNDHAIVIEHRAYEPGEHIPTDKPVPGHQRVAYDETTRLADASDDPRLRRALAKLNGFGAGATSVESTLWIATRGK